jgi:hypothetical protein
MWRTKAAQFGKVQILKALAAAKSALECALGHEDILQLDVERARKALHDAESKLRVLEDAITYLEAKEKQHLSGGGDAPSPLPGSTASQQQ